MPTIKCPTFFRKSVTKCANTPHTGDSKSCQYRDKTLLKPHMSRGGVGGGGSGFTLTGACRFVCISFSAQMYCTIYVGEV